MWPRQRVMSLPDITRSEHFCLGASLARTQIRAIFGELLQRIPNLEVGEPDYLVSNFINGVKRLPARSPAMRTGQQQTQSHRQSTIWSRIPA